MVIENRSKANSKIIDQIKKSLYNWIMYHPQVVQSPIVNDCLKVKNYGDTEPQLVTKLLFKVSIREFHNSIASDQVDGVLKD